MKKIITKDELGRVINRIIEEAKNQAKFKGEEFKGLTEKDIGKRIFERLGNDWVLQE